MIKKKIDKRNLRKGKTYEEIFDYVPKNMGFQENHTPWWIKRKTDNPSKSENARRKNSEHRRGKPPWNKGKKCQYVTERNLKDNPVWKHGVKEKIRESVIKKIKLCLDYSKRKPNYKEQFLDSILQTHFPDEFKFVGDGKFVIEGKVPDWINCNGKKLIIEFFGERWHEPKDEIIRKNIFLKYGYRTLVIWGRELNNSIQVVNKIQNFMEVNYEKANTNINGIINVAD